MSNLVYQAYLQGALHDGTRSQAHHTYRFSQKGTEWLVRLGDLLADLGHRSWMYREGKKQRAGTHPRPLEASR